MSCGWPHGPRENAGPALDTTRLVFLLPGVRVGHLSPVVLGLPGSMSSPQAKFPAGGHIATQPVGDHLPWRSPLPLHELAEKALSGSRVPAARDQNIQDVAVLVHRPPEIAA